METITKKQGIKVLAGITTLSIFSTGYFLLSNAHLNNSLSEAQSEAVAMMSAKNSVENTLMIKNKDLEKYKINNRDLSTYNFKLRSNLELTKEKILQQKKELASNTSTIKSLTKLNKTLVERIKIIEKDAFGRDDEIASLKKYIALQEAQINSLRQANKQLTDNRIYQAEITTLKNKNKISVIASKTNKIILQCSLSSANVEDLTFTLVNAKGIIAESNKDNGFTISSLDETYENRSQIKMEYTPKNKLTRGKYKILVSNADSEIGSYTFNLK